MTELLVLTHTPDEGPGRLGDWLTAAGAELRVLRPWAGNPVPATVGADGLVVLGGPQQAYDDASGPWLADTKALLRSAVADGVPTLGVCLGAQLLAQACGGSVEAGADGPEIGVRLVGRRDAATEDPLLWDTPMMWVGVQMHWDAVTDLPPGAVLLASSPRYDNQVFRVGEAAWGLQMHVEVDEPTLRWWGERYADDIRAAGLDPEAVTARAVAELPELADLWQPVAERFVALARGAGRRLLPVV